MWKFILRRTLIMIPQLFVLSVIIFALAQAMPGDVLTNQILSNPDIDPATIAEQREKLGLNDPAPVQYWNWLSGLAHGNLGVSFIHQTPVTTLIGERLINTIFLSACILVLTYAIAVPLGIAGGRWPNSMFDKFITGYTYFSYATPLFVFALLSLFVFGFTLNWFPTGGSVDPRVDPGTFPYIVSKIYHMILPALAQAVLSTAIIIQYLKNEIIETKLKDFVLTAHSKGVPESKIYSRHILRNSFLPVAAFLGYSITGIIGGHIFIETIFSYPGIGQLFIQSITQRDYPVVTTLMMISGLAALIGTLLSDIILSAVDPRIRIN